MNEDVIINVVDEMAEEAAMATKEATGEVVTVAVEEAAKSGAKELLKDAAVIGGVIVTWEGCKFVYRKAVKPCAKKVVKWFKNRFAKDDKPEEGKE